MRLCRNRICGLSLIVTQSPDGGGCKWGEISITLTPAYRRQAFPLPSRERGILEITLVETDTLIFKKTDAALRIFRLADLSSKSDEVKV